MPEETAAWTVHAVKAGRTLCGAVNPPMPFGSNADVSLCAECGRRMEGVPEFTMDGRVEETRRLLRQKLRSFSEADRARWKDQMRTFASAALFDAPSAPSLWSHDQLLAAFYALESARAGAYEARRAGMRSTWRAHENALVEIEISLLAIVEGFPV